MDKQSKLHRVKEVWAEQGAGGTWRVVADYAKWKMHGSPVEILERASPTYEAWMGAYANLRPQRSITHPNVGFSIICPVYNTPPRLLNECVGSVLDQTHENWELILVDDASTSTTTREMLAAAQTRDRRIRLVTLDENGGIGAATNAGIGAAGNDYTVFMDHDDRLAPGALEWLSTCCPVADLVYTDEDKITEDGEHWGPFFKPSWSPRLLLGLNYINHLTCVRTSLLNDVGGILPGTDGVQDHDLLLRLSERDITVAHVPFVAYHWRAWSESVAGNPSSKVEVEARGLEMVQRAIDRRGWNARASLGDGAPFNYRVLFNEPVEQPTVKIIIPTRDHLRMLRQTVDGVFNRTDGIDFHLVVVDNGSVKPKTLAYLDALAHDHDNVTVVRIDDAFNFSVLCNAGAVAGPETPYLLFLNNDIEILHREWLQQLVGWLDADPGVVGVGAKLLFPDRSIQHAGVIIGFGGIAGHYAAREPNQPSLGNLHDQAREVACVTAACMLVRTEDFKTVDGFNETLHLDFQDVDFSLRLRTELGGELLYDPTYPMIHLESATRGSAGASNGYTVARMRFLWGDLLSSEDPYYSPHFSLNHHDFTLRDLPDDEGDLREHIEARWTGTPSDGTPDDG
jgi:glycosyltransferase involved in cell wall biosynthesis